MFDIKFLENASEFDRGVTQRNELQGVVLDSVPKVAVLCVDFLKLIFALIARTLSGIRLNNQLSTKNCRFTFRLAYLGFGFFVLLKIRKRKTFALSCTQMITEYIRHSGDT